MTDKTNISLTPSDIVGALHRSAIELAQYLSANGSMAVDVPNAKAHLAQMFEKFDALESMQDAVKAHAQQNGAEARAN